MPVFRDASLFLTGGDVLTAVAPIRLSSENATEVSFAGDRNDAAPRGATWQLGPGLAYVRDADLLRFSAAPRLCDGDLERFLSFFRAESL